MRKDALESRDFGKLSQCMEAKSTSIKLMKYIEQERKQAKVDKKFRFWRVYWNFSKKRMFWSLMAAFISFIGEFIGFVSYSLFTFELYLKFLYYVTSLECGVQSLKRCNL